MPRTINSWMLGSLLKAKSLSEAIDAFKQAKKDEMKEAKTLFEEYKVEWKKKEKKREAAQEACRMLNGIIVTLRGSEHHYFLRDLIKLSVPRKVEEIIDREVSRRLQQDIE